MRLRFIASLLSLRAAALLSQAGQDASGNVRGCTGALPTTRWPELCR